jgi:hypothetical protein
VRIEGEIEHAYTLKVTNMLGVTVITQEGATNGAMETEVDLSVLPRGIYFVEITDRVGKSTRRIVKE